MHHVRPLRFVMMVAIALVGVSASMGCNSKADNTPNPNLGAPPTIPPGRGSDPSKAMPSKGGDPKSPIPK